MDTDTVPRRNGGGFTVYDSGDVKLPSKTCNKCGTTYTGKEIATNFAKRSDASDGYRSGCKACDNEAQRDRRRKAKQNDMVQESLDRVMEKLIREKLGW